MHSLEVVFDADLDDAVRSEWRMLHDAGLPSQADHTGASNRPHLTVLVRSELPTEAPAAVASLPIAVRLGPLLVLGRGARRALARTLLVDMPLAALHRAVLASARCEDDEWTPHVTLARRLPIETIPAALAVLGDVPVLTGFAVGLRHWDGDAKIETQLIQER